MVYKRLPCHACKAGIQGGFTMALDYSFLPRLWAPALKGKYLFGFTLINFTGRVTDVEVLSDGHPAMPAGMTG